MRCNRTDCDKCGNAARCMTGQETTFVPMEEKRDVKLMRFQGHLGKPGETYWGISIDGIELRMTAQKYHERGSDAAFQLFKDIYDAMKGE